MDITAPSEGVIVGSIPAESTLLFVIKYAIIRFNGPRDQTAFKGKR